MTKINIHLGNSETAMQSMPENKYGLAIADPPYGLNIDGQKEQLNNKNKKHNRKGHKKKNWDNSPPDKSYFDNMFNISSDQIIFGANYFPQYLKSSKGWIVWYKGQEGLTMSDAELAFSSFNTPTRVCKINRVQLMVEGATFHPTTKPIKIYKWLLKNYGFNKDGTKRTIFDSHGGSMSIVIACMDMGFDIDIWELDPDYYNDAVARVKRHLAQQDLTREPVDINYIKD